MKRIIFIILIPIILSVCVIAIWRHNLNSHKDFPTLSNTVKQGVEKAERGEHEAAIADYDTAIIFNSNDAAAYYYRGKSKAALGHHFAAVTDYDNAIRLHHNNFYVYFSRALSYSSLDQHGYAITDYDNAIRLHPKSAAAYHNRAVEKHSHGLGGLYFTSDVIDDYTTAIRLDPDDALFYLNRGGVYLNKGRYLAAISDFDNVIRLSRNDAKGYYYRGKAKQALVEENNSFTLLANPEARQDWETALKLANQNGNVVLQNKIESTLRKYNIPIK